MSRACGGCKNILRFFTSYETRNDISGLSCLILTHKRAFMSLRVQCTTCSFFKKNNVLTIRASNHSDLKTPK